ncbi:MAG TPA: methyltransferase [Kofleriaceae bacterium]|nr:methyltransferase [Kofleriaceae bacterium]
MQLARAAFRTLADAGYTEAAVARWFGVPLVTDARYVPAPVERVRRAVGGFIALWVAGEALPRGALGLVDAGAWEAWRALGLVTIDGDTVRANVTVLPARGLLLVSDAARAPDLSAYNLAAALPRLPGARAFDVGCGAGIVTLAAAAAGGDAVGGDIDREVLAFARLNAALNGSSARFVESDLFEAAEGRYDLVTFNAPLLRAPLATSGEEPSRYATTPEGDRLALRFLDGLPAHLTDRGEALLHAQLTPRLDAALDALAGDHAVGSAVFARATDGTPHALTRIGAGRGRRTIEVPLGPLCPHLSSEIVGALTAARTLDPDATPVPAPWLELRLSRQLGGRFRSTRFGVHPVDDAEVALLERLGTTPVSLLGLDADDAARLERFVALGLVILR